MSAEPSPPSTWDGQDPVLTCEQVSRAGELLDLFARRADIVAQMRAALTTSLTDLARVTDAERELSALPPEILRAAVDERRARRLRERRP